MRVVSLSLQSRAGKVGAAFGIAEPERKRPEI